MKTLLHTLVGEVGVAMVAEGDVLQDHPAGRGAGAHSIYAAWTGGWRSHVTPTSTLVEWISGCWRCCCGAADITIIGII